MRITEMTSKESRELLARQGGGRLACSRDNQPYIVPIYFTAEGDNLYCFATLGQKIEWMRTNPLVCVQADEIRGPSEWKSVVVFGRYEELPDDAEHEQSRRHAITILSRHDSWWVGAYAADQVRKHGGEPTPIIFCVHMAQITGHRADPDAAQVAMDVAQQKW
jgi:nitroimidazol reductase NimA-like FMN-containing flavoprotein (pyridoxamine 5'-phosphate oxidase superfamily)